MSIERRLNELREEKEMEEQRKLQARRDLEEKIARERREAKRREIETAEITKNIREKAGLDVYIQELEKLFRQDYPRSLIGTENFITVNRENGKGENIITVSASTATRKISVIIVIDTDGTIQVSGIGLIGRLTANEQGSETQLIDFLAKAFEEPDILAYDYYWLENQLEMIIRALYADMDYYTQAVISLRTAHRLEDVLWEHKRQMLVAMKPWLVNRTGKELDEILRQEKRSDKEYLAARTSLKRD